jgi:uridine kinase
MSFILLIEGGTSSGKSTLADYLSLNLRSRSTVSLLKQDNYYKDLSCLTGKEIESYNFDSPCAINLLQFADDLKKLADGTRIKKRIYSFKNHCSHISDEWIEPAEIVIGEGLFVFNVEIDNAVRIFIDIDDDIRFIRRMQRDMVERAIPYQKTIEHYLHTVKPMHEKYIKPSKKDADILLSDSGESTIEEIAGNLIYKLKGYIG